MKFPKIGLLLLLCFTHYTLTINVFREEDFYLLHSTHDLTIYQSAIEEISKVLERSRLKKIYKNSAGSSLIFEDLQRRVLALRKSLKTLTSPTFSSTSYLKKTEDSDNINLKFDTQLYDLHPGLDGFEAFHLSEELQTPESTENGNENDLIKYVYNPPENRMVRVKRSNRAKRALFDFVGESLSYIAGTPGPTEYKMFTKQTEKQKIAILKGNKMSM